MAEQLTPLQWKTYRQFSDGVLEAQAARLDEEIAEREIRRFAILQILGERSSQAAEVEVSYAV